MVAISLIGYKLHEYIHESNILPVPRPGQAPLRGYELRGVGTKLDENYLNDFSYLH